MGQAALTQCKDCNLARYGEAEINETQDGTFRQGYEEAFPPPQLRRDDKKQSNTSVTWAADRTSAGALEDENPDRSDSAVLERRDRKDTRTLTRDLSLLSAHRPILFHEFMTGFTELCWPYVAKTFTKSFVEKVETSLMEAVEKYPALAKFRDKIVYSCEFNEDSSNAFSFVEIYSYKKHLTLDEGVEICGRMKWSPTMNFNLKIGPVSIGMDKMTLDGVGCACAKPLLENDPVIGGAQIFFCDLQNLDMNFTGMGGLTSWDSIHSMMMGVCRDTFNKMFVLPSRFSLRFANTYIHDWPSYRCPHPMGLLRVHLLDANDLLAADVNYFGPNSSDPYCKLKIGTTEHKSTVIKKNLNPVWNSETEFFDFPVHHERQPLHLTVYDQDILKKDDLLGRLPRKSDHSVMNLLDMQRKQGFFGIRLPLDTVGTVRIGLKYVSFASKSSPPPRDPSSPSLVSVKIYHLHGLGEDFAPGAKVRVTIGHHQEVSKKIKRIHPKEFHGFGKKQTAQMHSLHKSGAEVGALVEAFDLPEEIVEELLDHVNKSETGLMRFGWDESIHITVDEAAASRESVHLEICIKDTWYELGRRTPIVELASRRTSIGSRDDPSDQSRHGDPWHVANFPGGKKVWVGICLVRRAGVALEDTAAVAKFVVGRSGGIGTKAGKEEFNQLRDSRPLTDWEGANSFIGQDEETDDDEEDEDDGEDASKLSQGMRAVSREIKRSNAQYFDWTDNFDSQF